MQPQKYLNDLESSRRRSGFIQNALVSACFVASFLIIGPMIHEAAHIAVLQFYNCFYNFSFDFSLLSGLHAKVTPLCAPADSRLLLFYSVGYLSTLVAAGLTSILAIRRVKWSRYLAATGSGLFLSILLSIGAEGDIQNAIKVLGLSQSYSLMIVLIIVTGVFLSSLRTLQLFTASERQE